MTRDAPGRIERRIFVVGVARSGTTLVQSLLAGHSLLTSFTESHFFDRHFTHLPGLKTPLLTRNPEPRLREFLAENGAEPPSAARGFTSRASLRFRPLLPLRTSRVARQFLRVLDQLTLERSKAGWIEKTPRHLRYVPFLEALDREHETTPRTDFIHVVRDGLQTVASLHKASQHWQVPYDVDTCVRRWNDDVAFSLSRIGAPRDHFVAYERLTADPEATLRKLSTDLDLTWEPEILDRFAERSNRLVTPGETWKQGHGRTIRPSATAREVLSDEQIRRVSNSLDHELYQRLFGQAPPSAPESAPD